MWNSKNTERVWFSNSEEVREGCMEEETVNKGRRRLNREENGWGRGRAGMRSF